MDRAEYKAYLGSKRWAGKRKRRLRRDNKTCQTCGETMGLEVHHRTYERVGRERLSDLVTLCSWCHDAISGSIRRRGIDQHWPKGASAQVNRILARLDFL